MNLLCIQTHSQGAVQSGNVYTATDKTRQCNCSDLLDVGIRLMQNCTAIIQCVDCGRSFEYDGIWWISKELFAPIATEKELMRQVEAVKI